MGGPDAWPFRVYMAAWCALTLAALGLALHRRRTLSLFGRDYLGALIRPWKLVTFALSAGFFLVIAPFSGDPTWDRVDAGVMSALTYLTAPWAVGTLYRALRRRSSAVDVFVAIVVWMFSASWSYDGWLVIRDGRYPPTWASNILASSILYLSAGLFWSVTHAAGRGVVFSFMLEWPAHDERTSLRVLGFALVFALLVLAMMSPFILNALDP